MRDVQARRVFSEQRGYAFNGYAVSSEEGTVLIDPPEPGEDGWPTVDRLERGGHKVTLEPHPEAA